MKNIIGKILCWIGIHKLDEDEWSGAGMCDALVEVIISDEEFFTKDA